MRNFIAVFLILFVHHSLLSQWNTTSNGIYYSAGKVGIGTTPTSTHSLLIYGSNSQNLLKVQNNRTSDAGIEFKSSVSNFKIGAGIGVAANVFSIYDLNASKVRFVIDDQGDVGIKSGFGPFGYSLVVRDTDNTPGLQALGLRVEADAYNRGAYGIVGIASTNFPSFSNPAVGVWGEAPNLNYHYAGYFNGDLAYTDNLYEISDERLKEDIDPIDNGMEVIKMLKPHEYRLKQDNNFGFDDGKKSGFMAQDIQDVLPHLTKKGGLLSLTEEIDEDYLAVNYIGLIPYLVSAIHEQQELIDKLQTLLNTFGKNNLNFQSELPQILNLFPNPTSKNIRIEITSVSESDIVRVALLSKSGETIESHDVAGDSISFPVNQLPPDVYLVQLIVNDTIFDVKRIIVE